MRICIRGCIASSRTHRRDTEQEVGPLPVEIIAHIYEAILTSKYECQRVEDPWYRVNEQIRFSTMISACGVEHGLVNDATSRDQSPCPSFQPATEATENVSMDYTQAVDLDWALESEDIRYQGNVVGALALDDDIMKRLSLEPCPAEETISVDKSTSLLRALKRKQATDILEENMMARETRRT